MDAEFVDGKIIVQNGKELYEKGFFGTVKGNDVELDNVEALFLLERGRIKIFRDGKSLDVKDFFHLCCSLDPRFEFKYTVYKDLRTRGFSVRPGFKGCDFRVYERGSKPGKKEKIKWIVFCNAEDYPCNLDQLAMAIKLAKNIRTTALWAVVDNDSDVTYYIINESENL
ncbi:MAG: tRNA-intron lyase [Candidatus Micrarchaeota archaeon]|nr:tRNA-intron lyase [Candidatus Micrarchaeota archaeon]